MKCSITFSLPLRSALEGEVSQQVSWVYHSLPSCWFFLFHCIEFLWGCRKLASKYGGLGGGWWLKPGSRTVGSHWLSEGFSSEDNLVTQYFAVAYFFATLETFKKSTCLLQKWINSPWVASFLSRWCPNIKYLSKTTATDSLSDTLTRYHTFCVNGLNEFPCYVFLLQKIISVFFHRWSPQYFEGGKKGKPNQSSISWVVKG